MVRWGNDSDWKEIHWVGWGKAVGIKSDGSLWEWDTIYGSAYRRWSGWVIPPQMPSEYTDWVCTGAVDNAFLALAQDGTLCLWGDPQNGHYWDWDGPDPKRLFIPTRIKAHRVVNFTPENHVANFSPER
jgi:hypothetical protein